MLYFSWFVLDDEGKRKRQRERARERETESEGIGEMTLVNLQSARTVKIIKPKANDKTELLTKS